VTSHRAGKEEKKIDSKEKKKREGGRRVRFNSISGVLGKEKEKGGPKELRAAPTMDRKRKKVNVSGKKGERKEEKSSRCLAVARSKERGRKGGGRRGGCAGR